VANHHFGEIGDVWKHLVLGDLLDLVRPARYWETHAGSGTYVLDRSWQREYGVFTMLREAPRAPAIEASRYVWLVRTLPPGDDEQPRYPGSARLAMEVLGDTAAYLCCELDPASVADLTRSARELDLADIVRVERAGRDAARARMEAGTTFDIETPFLHAGSRLHPGVGGCAMMLANVPAETLDHVERLGRQLAACYDEVLLPDGTPGALRFTRTELA
jgi:hypothetical protein